ncbi:MAG: flippase [Rhizonema sp. PD37]|nr:flippase [Rhizonema sp. PD37]
MLNKLSTVSQKLSPNLLKILGNTAWLFADKVVRMVVGLLVGVWVARYLGPDNFGIYNYALAFTGIFDTVANLGLDSIVVRNIVRQPSSKDEILGTSFALKMMAQIIVLITAIAFISIFRPGDILTHWLVGIIAGGMLFESFYVIEYWFQSQVQSKYVVWYKNVALMIASCARVILIETHATLIFFAWVYSAEFALNAISLVIAYHTKKYLFSAWQFSWRCARDLLKDSWTLILSSFAIMILMRIDQLMLGQMIGDRAVGIYSVAVKISELWYFVPLAVTSSVFPSIIAAKQESNKLYYDRLQKVLDFLSIISYTVAILVTLFSEHLVIMLYGKSYEEAAAILTIHIWTGIFVSSGLVGSLWTTSENLMPFAFLTTAIGAVINVSLNYILIKTYGGVGSAIATLIAQCVASYLGGAFFAKTRPFFFRQTNSLILPSLLIRVGGYIKDFRNK